jgi:hypothetical protein
VISIADELEIVSKLLQALIGTAEGLLEGCLRLEPA